MPTTQASALLKHVLSKEEVNDSPSPSTEPKKISASLSQRLSVGARLADARKRTIEAASRIRGLSEGETAEAISTLAQELENSTCCVAFAGQVKAGKSTLINVLVEEPGLLPADINPWTTVITRLHFGVPGKPQSGASFTTFNHDEWRRLSIGGRTRELTERLFPDFDWKALNSQVDSMQERARRKLGPRFEELLGTEHTFPELTPGLLNRYVGAGNHGIEEHAPGAEGEFSDITKLADVYLDLGAFSFPTVLVDTPGVNDPFLVRDEITRQNLQAADICVIVLTARQPLSTADLGLLRTLRGLKKDRLVIFVNKVDQIGGGESVLSELHDHVSAILKREFPSARIPIVFGSAIWARQAMTSSVNGSPEPLNDSSQDASIFAWPSHDEIADTVAAETFFQKSGVSSLALAISELMQAAPIAGAIHSTASLLEAVCSNLILWLETEADVHRSIPADLASAQGELEALIALRERLASEIDALSNRLAEISTQKITSLHQELLDTAQLLTAEYLAALPDDGTAAQASQIDARLRIKLESVFSAAVEEVGKLIAIEQEALRMELARLFEASRLRGKPAIIVGRPLDMSPSLAALSEPAGSAILGELAAPLEDRSAYLSKVILADFEPIIEALAGEASRCFHVRSANLIQQMKALTLNPLDITIQRIARAIQRAEEPDSVCPLTSQDSERQIQALRETILDLQLVLAREEEALPPKYAS